MGNFKHRKLFWNNSVYVPYNLRALMYFPSGRKYSLQFTICYFLNEANDANEANPLIIIFSNHSIMAYIREFQNNKIHYPIGP